VAQVVEHLPSKSKALSSNTSTAKNKTKQQQKKNTKRQHTEWQESLQIYSYTTLNMPYLFRLAENICSSHIL
jgi:hypothetical protein